MTKQCCRCHIIKEAEAFSPDKRAKDGFQGSCRQCSNEDKKKKYRANVEESRKKRRDYYKRNSETILATNAKSREKNKASVLEGKKRWYEKAKVDPVWQENEKARRIKNRGRKQEYDRKYYQENPEKKSRMAREWMENNKERRASIVRSYDARRRAWVKDGDTTRDIHNWTSRQEKICYWCGIFCLDRFHVDHYQPLSKGGKHEIPNLVISCPRCNLKKNAKDPYDFANSLGRLF